MNESAASVPFLIIHIDLKGGNLWPLACFDSNLKLTIPNCTNEVEWNEYVSSLFFQSWLSPKIMDIVNDHLK